MKKTILTIAVGLALVMLLLAGTVSAGGRGRGGPVEKATGFVTLYEPWDDGHREVDFNAHEKTETRAAKGSMVDTVYAPAGVVRRVFQYDIRYVRVQGDYVHFGALCTYDSGGTHVGRWLYVKALDGGTPATAGDRMGWKWGTEGQVQNWVSSGSSTGWWRVPIAGNLVVHTY